MAPSMGPVAATPSPVVDRGRAQTASPIPSFKGSNNSEAKSSAERIRQGMNFASFSVYFALVLSSLLSTGYLFME